MIKVSVIVPVYNMEKNLRKCLNSLVNQTLDNIEIIVINDGSTDDCLKIIKEYAKKYSNIVVISRENRGISASRNEGIKIAKGTYLGFVDSDDYIKLDMYEKLYNKIINDESDIVICDYEKYNDKMNEKVIVGKNYFPTRLINTPSLINDIDYAPWNKLYKKELFDNIEFPKLKYEDLNAILKVFLKAKKISKVNESLYMYYINPYGESNTFNEKDLDIIKIIDDLNKYFKNNINYLTFEQNLKILAINKLFYLIKKSLIYNSHNYSIIDKCFKFFDNNYLDWKNTYINLANDKKERIKRRLRSNKFLFKLYVRLK